MNKKRLLLLSLIAAVGVLLYLHSLKGYSLSIVELFTNYFSSKSSIESVLWMEIRMPRIVMAGGIGAALALSGYCLQVLVKNPLADPYVLGSSSGASLMVALVYLVFPTFIGSVFNSVGAAFVGALGANVLTMFIAQKIKYSTYALVLVGMALSGFSMALVSFIMYLQSNPMAIQQLVFWSFGSMHLATWLQVSILLPVVALSILLLHLIQLDLTILELGADQALRLGVSVKRIQWILLVVASILTALSVAFVGPIGFIGLLFPHFVRKVLSYEWKRWYIFILALSAALFLMYCDWIAYVAIQPSGMPVGIVLALIGVPIFIYFLIKRNPTY
jgi:iron complex transport system permease protein